MIGIMNVPCESATEYYATPELRPKAVSPAALPKQKIYSTEAGFRQTNQKRLFARRRSSQINYLKDGRKLFDGKLTENSSAPQMWEKLLLRSLVHKIEDGVGNPAPTEKLAKQQLFSLTESGTVYTTSTLSLVSKDLLQSNISAQKYQLNMNMDSLAKKRSHSYDCVRQPANTTKIYQI